MSRIFIDIDNLQSLIFERRQIVALLDDIELWRKIPLAQRFAIVDSGEFATLMGPAYAERMRELLESEIEAMVATLH